MTVSLLCSLVLRRLESRGRSDVEGNYRDVVVLSEVFGGLRDVASGLVTDLLCALEAEEFAVTVCGLNHTVGKEDEPVAFIELESGLGVANVGDYTKRKVGCQLHFAAIAIGAQVPRVGDGHGSVGVDTRAKAGSEAEDWLGFIAGAGGCSEHDLVEMVENCGGVV